MKNLFNRVVPGVSSTIPALALAHPGHGEVAGWAHWFAPEHVLPGLVVLAVLVYFLCCRKGHQ